MTEVVKVFVRWCYGRIKFKSFLFLYCRLNKTLYDYINRVIPEVEKFRKYKGMTGYEIFCNTDFGLSCSRYLASQLLLWQKEKYTTQNIRCVRAFMENPNLGYRMLNTHPEAIVGYYLAFKSNFKDDRLFKNSLLRLDSLSIKCVWEYIETTQTLSYCLNNFPQYIPHIVNTVLKSSNLQLEFLQVIDNYKDNLYSPLQKKQALTLLSKKRNRCEIIVDDGVKTKSLVDNMNNITSFLLKKNKSF